jgi:hypothetical protein
MRNEKDKNRLVSDETFNFLKEVEASQFEQRHSEDRVIKRDPIEVALLRLPSDELPKQN